MTTRFTGRNALGATVNDVDTKEKINHVMAIDIEKNHVECSYYPIRMNGTTALVAGVDIKLESL